MNTDDTPRKTTDKLTSVLGADKVFQDNEISHKYLADWSAEKGGTPAALVIAHDTRDVSETLRICNEHHQPVVPQGGRTGLAGGATPLEGCVVLSLERMNGIEALDTDSATMTVLAGTPLQTIQDAATEVGYLCGLDLGARGSCQIGGNIATNAGGNRVIRYGTARDQVLGMEVVLPDGTVLPMLNKMIKNNTGPDLKQLFIGSEGIMGVITKVILRLHPGISGANTALVALEDFKSATRLLNYTRQAFSGRVSAFELMWGDYYKSATTIGGVRPPLDPGYPMYVLLDVQSPSPDDDAAHFEAVLEQAWDKGWVADAAIAQSLRDEQNFWNLRDSVAEMLPKLAPTLNFDVSVPITDIGTCVERMRADMNYHFPDISHMYFGHIGDSNIHAVVGPLPDDEGDTEHRIEQAFYSIVRDFSGSVSAEHGIGLHKRPWLKYSRTPEEIQLMQTLKNALDPNGIMNPEKVVAP